MRVVLDNWGCALHRELVVRAVDELMLVGVVLNRPLTVAVMDWQAMHLVITLGCVVACIAVVMRVEMMRIVVSLVVPVIIHVFVRILPVVWLISSQGVVPVPMGRLGLAIKDLLALWLDKVHAQCLCQVAGAFLSVYKIGTI